MRKAPERLHRIRSAECGGEQVGRYVLVAEVARFSVLNLCEFSLDNIKPERARTDVKFYEVALLEFVASDWVSAIFCNIFFNKPAFVDMAWFDGDNGFLGWLAWDCTEHHFTEKDATQLFLGLLTLVDLCLLLLTMSEKRLVLAIIDFLNHSVDDGTVKGEDKESLDIASMFSVYLSPKPCLIRTISPVHRRVFRRRSNWPRAG